MSGDQVTTAQAAGVDAVQGRHGPVGFGRGVETCGILFVDGEHRHQLRIRQGFEHTSDYSQHRCKGSSYSSYSISISRSGRPVLINGHGGAMTQQRNESSPPTPASPRLFLCLALVLG
ncbi:MAG: hypothetical protein QOD87_2425 [Pseudonocardiales bacterium]|nr:hypothetical protein [Pseudonocardiales bacterium]